MALSRVFALHTGKLPDLAAGCKQPGWPLCSSCIIEVDRFPVGMQRRVFRGTAWRRRWGDRQRLQCSLWGYGVGIVAVTSFENTLSVPLESTAVTTQKYVVPACTVESA